MPYNKQTTKVEEINWLGAARYQNFTFPISNAGVTADANGRKIVKSGTVYPANDATAKGIVFNDVDVTEGTQPGAVMVEGYVIGERLPVVVSDEAKTALKEIKFR